MCRSWCTVDNSAVLMAPRSGRVGCVLNERWGREKGVRDILPLLCYRRISATVRSYVVRQPRSSVQLFVTAIIHF